jgi:branched-chain amino acid transport system substrate-binding protein
MLQKWKWMAAAFVVAAIAGLGLPKPAHAIDVCGAQMKEATGEPIKLGAIVSKTGPADFSSAGRSALAFFKCVNAHGGINGRPVQLLIEDDFWNPEKAASAARKLVLDDKVVAMAGSTSFVECGTNEAFYEEHDIGVITGVGVPRECFFSKNNAPVNMGPRLSNYGAVKYAYEEWGARNFVCMAPNVPNVGGWFCPAIETEWGKGKGVTVHSILHDPATMDATSLVLQALSFKPDVVIVSEPGPGAVAVLNAAEDQGVRDKTKWIGPTSLYDRAFPKAVGSYWNDHVFVQIELNTFDSKGPDNQAWIEIMDKYGAKSDVRDSFSQAGFVAAKFMTAVLRDMKGPINPKTVLAALRHMKPVTSDLICLPWEFGEGKRHNANQAGRMVKVSGGGWKKVRDCFRTDDPELNDIPNHLKK